MYFMIVSSISGVAGRPFHPSVEWKTTGSTSARKNFPLATRRRSLARHRRLYARPHRRRDGRRRPADIGACVSCRYDRPDMTEAGEDRVGGEVDAPEARSRRPDWFHRGHPVFFPLAGFFTGMVSVIVVPGLYAAIVKWVAGYERVEELFPFVLLMFVVPIGLLVPQHTRRFGRYLLLGMVSTVLVVAAVGAGVVWFLLNKDA